MISPLGSITVIEEFFGAEVGASDGAVTPEILCSLPSEQFLDLVVRIVDYNVAAYAEFQRGALASERLAPILDSADRWWSHAPDTARLKSLIAYAPQLLIPDPMWDVIEEVASFAAILWGHDPRTGLSECLRDVERIKVDWGPGDPFFTDPALYPASALEHRIRRLEAVGNNAAPLLAGALQPLISMRPLLATGELFLRPYPENRSGFSRQPQVLLDDQVASLSALFAAITGDAPDLRGVVGVVAPRPLRVPGARLWPIPELLFGSPADRLLNQVGRALTERNLPLGPNWAEIVLDIMTGRVRAVATQTEDERFLRELLKYLDIELLHPGRSTAVIAQVALPGLEAAPFEELVAIRMQSDAFASVRRGIGRAVDAAFDVELPTEAVRKRIVAEAMAELTPEVARLKKEMRRSATLPNIAAGLAGFGIGAFQWGTGGSLTLEGALSALATQVPWIAEYLGGRHRRGVASAELIAYTYLIGPGSSHRSTG